MLDKNKIISSIPTVVIGLALTIAFMVVATVKIPQRADAAPFTCETGFYQVIFGNLSRLDPVTGIYDSIGSTGAIGTNAIGYNPIDNYIYGWRGGVDGIVRIEHDATTTPLGVPAGLPVVGASYSGGDVDEFGNYYLIQNVTSNIYQIDLSTNTATHIPHTGPNPPRQEIVYLNGSLYNIINSSLFEINLSTGVVTEKPLAITPDPDDPGSVYGAGWAADGNKLFFARNSDGMIFEVTGFTGANPSAIPVLQGQTATSNDGASCATASSPIPPLPLSVANDTNSTTVNTAITGNVITNDSGQQITVTNYTQPTNGAVVVDPDGSYTYTPSNGFVGVDTFTYTITDAYGETQTATVTITIVAAEITSPEDDDELAATGIPQLTLLWGASALVMIMSLAAAYKAHGSIRS